MGSTGFTLIELLVVIGLMVIVGSIVVSNSFGLTKSSAATSSREISFNTLQYARQRACMDGKKTVVLFKDLETETQISVFQEASIVTDSTSDKVSDCYSGMPSIKGQPSGMIILWNFSEGKSFAVKEIKRVEYGEELKVVDPDYKQTYDNLPSARKKKRIYRAPSIEFIVDKKNSNYKQEEWREGDSYGFEISDRMKLPKDYVFEAGSGFKSIDDDNGFYVAFNADGSSDNGSITIIERFGNKKSIGTLSIQNGEILLGN